MHHDDDHDHGFAHDLGVMDRMVERRRALRWFAGAGTAALVASVGGSGSASGVSPTASAPLPTPATCIADPAETAGPYPADGTNPAGGSTSNVLPVSGIVRSDIRSSFIGTTTVATGVPLTLTLTVVDVNARCGALAGHAVYLWHCDRRGDYSLYTAPAESYLRGVQVTNAEGRVTFTTIVPACYSGRFPHIHFEIYPILPAATGGRHALLTSQLCMPSAVCDLVYADTIAYPSSRSNLAAVSLAGDMVFGDNTAAQIAQQTPSFSGSVAAGYTATAVLGIAR